MLGKAVYEVGAQRSVGQLSMRHTVLSPCHSKGLGKRIMSLKPAWDTQLHYLKKKKKPDVRVCLGIEPPGFAG